MKQNLESQFFGLIGFAALVRLRMDRIIKEHLVRP